MKGRRDSVGEKVEGGGRGWWRGSDINARESGEGKEKDVATRTWAFRFQVE